MCYFIEFNQLDRLLIDGVLVFDWLTKKDIHWLVHFVEAIGANSPLI